MTIFSGIPADLADTVGYELSAIEYIRSTLFDQNERTVGKIGLTLDDLTQDGFQKMDFFMEVTTNISGKAVKSALNHLRPLAFSAAFKMQDMVAQWILRANGMNDWQFRKKLDSYDRLRVGNSLIEPLLFVQRPLLARAFWELYRFFVPFRSTVIHSGGLVLSQDGTIEIVKGASNLSLTTAEQGSYLRAICMITKHFLGLINLNPFLDALIEADFFGLEMYHGQAGFTVQRAQCAAVTVNVPTTHVINQHPLLVRIDFDHVCKAAERAFSVGIGGRLFFAVEISVDVNDRTAVWNIPLESVPRGIVTLQQGDGTYDRFLRLTAKSQ
jgi:hypothetical protein